MKKFNCRIPLLVLLCVFCIGCTGCGLSSFTERKNTADASPGFRDGVGSFLFNFDDSTRTQALAKAIKKGEIPSRVTWYYEKGGTSRDGEEGELEDNSSTSTDPAKIMDIFNALSNTVVMGVSHDQSSYTHYFISFTLRDGSETRYDFVSENVLRLGDQNYVVETAAGLWEMKP